MQQEWLIHDSHLPFFRSPFGAVSCHTPIILNLAVAGTRQPAQVMVRVWRHDHGEERIIMKAGEVKNGYQYYQATVLAPPQPGWLWYYFIVESRGELWYYGNNGELGGQGQLSSEPPSAWQITVHEEGMSTPAWFKESVMYQIFVDRFYNGHEDGRVEHAPHGSVLHAHWDNNPVYVRDMKNGRILAYDFFGGNLAGVMAKLPYLQELGVGVLYFNPIFTAPSNHKYDTADYKNIDPMFGNNELFRQLCAKAEEMGIAVILDGVFSHTGSDSIYFNRQGNYPAIGAYQSKASPYYDWYRFHEWPDDYESWWGIDTLPNVEELDPSYQKFIIDGNGSVVKHWAALGVKGWRLDVADELPDQFIEKFRHTLKQHSADAVLIGEVWEDASRKESYGVLRPYFQGGQLDSVMNYPFRRVVLDFFLGNKTAQEANRLLMSLKENYPKHQFYACMNLLSSHDVPRVLTLLGDEEYGAELSAGQLAVKRLTTAQRVKAVARFKAAALWQMTFPGVPSIYYGDEAGVEGYTDPLNRRTYPWGREDKELLDWHKQLTALRKEYAVLRTGDWQPLPSSPDVLVYIRTITNGYDVFGQSRENNVAIVLINRLAQAKTVSLEVADWVQSSMLYDMLCHEAEVAAGDGAITVTLEPYEGKVLLERVHTEHKTYGVLLHPTSLPSAYGIGDFGSDAQRFIDFLAAAGQSLWQVLPFNPPGIGDSPYMALSAFAGNQLLISPEKLIAAGWVSAEAVEEIASNFELAKGTDQQVQFAKVKSFKEALFRQAFISFCHNNQPADYDRFLQDNSYWLEDYVLFMAISDYYGGQPWTEWEAGLVKRDNAVLAQRRLELADEIAYHTFLQYVFFKQWHEVKAYANEKGIQIIGDMPIFVAHNSSDVWAYQSLFALDEVGNPALVAGVPPDYFSDTGQLWGNPLYRWDLMASDDYRWWRERFACLLKQVDSIRVDHFRGFESYWEIAADEETAINGRWVKGPGANFFHTLEKHLGQLPVIAEDLGIITEEVVKLKNELAFPGMKVLHFCFGQAQHDSYPPLGIERDSIVYTGTHDNNTTIGWYENDLEKSVIECVDAYLGSSSKTSAEELCWRLIELAYQSKGRTVIIPIQDILALDSTARMNLPGTVGGNNWAWRCCLGYLAGDIAAKLRGLVAKYGEQIVGGEK